MYNKHIWNVKKYLLFSSKIQNQCPKYTNHKYHPIIPRKRYHFLLLIASPNEFSFVHNSTREKKKYRKLGTIDPNYIHDRGESINRRVQWGRCNRAQDVHRKHWIESLTKINLIKIIVPGTGCVDRACKSRISSHSEIRIDPHLQLKIVNTWNPYISSSWKKNPFRLKNTRNNYR